MITNVISSRLRVGVALVNRLLEVVEYAVAKVFGFVYVLQAKGLSR